MSSSSLPLACILSPSPRTKYLLSSTSSTPKLSTKRTFSPLACKLVETSHHIPFGKSLSRNALSATTAENAITSSTLTNDEWEAEKETLLNQIDGLVLRVQQLSSASGDETSSSTLDGILKDMYSLGTKVLGLEPKDSVPTPSSVTQALMDLVGKFEVLATSDDDGGLLQIDPNPVGGKDVIRIDQLVDTVSDVEYKDLPTPDYLRGNFGPIFQETPPTPASVVYGEIPASLNGGMLFRNGPNPKYAPEGNYSWMDGNSMIHGLQFKDGNATYVSRYVDNSRLEQEEHYRRSQFFKYGDLYGYYGLFALFIQLLRAELKIVDLSYGDTTSNTSIAYHGGRLMALCDFGKPHALYVGDDGDITTVGINDYDGKLNHWFTPHPKIDPVTGEMFTFGAMYTSPYCIFNVISKDGVMGDNVNITVPDPTYMHDMGLTENYVVFMDLPYVFNVEKMVKNDDWIYNLDANKKARFGVLPRYATSEEGIKWFEFEDDLPFFIYHNGNAYEDDDGNIVMYSCLMNPTTGGSTPLLYLAPLNNRRASKHPLDLEPTLPRLFKLTFNLTTMKCTRERLANTFVDSPAINERLRGRPSRYLYTIEVNEYAKLPSIRKYDLTANKETTYEFDEGVYASGEAIFVPNSDDPTSEEDDGHLLVFLHNENTDVSYAYILDAQTLGIVTQIQLPSRVPYGFHSLFLTGDDLQAQKQTST